MIEDFWKKTRMVNPRNSHDNVDGRNPGTVEVGSLSPYWHGFIHPRWCRISSINSRWEGEGSSILSSFAVRKRWRFKPVGFDVQLTVRLGGIKRSSTIFAHQFKWTAVVDVGIGCMAGWMALKKGKSCKLAEERNAFQAMLLHHVHNWHLRKPRCHWFPFWMVRELSVIVVKQGKYGLRGKAKDV